MKIVCGSCQAKYSIADEKVAGKVFKIRCKRCSEVIVVRGDHEGTPAAVNNNAHAQAPADEAPSDAIWHAVLNGEQAGPYSPEQLAELVRNGQLDWEAYVWCEGFENWQPMREVPQLVAAISGQREEVSSASQPIAQVAQPSMGADPFADEIAHGDMYAKAAGGGGGGHAVVSRGVVSGGYDAGPKMIASVPSPRVTTEQAMTGARNENSVLFSLKNLQALGTGPVSTPVSARPGHAGGEGSGLIDIRALATTTGVSEDHRDSRDKDALLSLGSAQAGAFGALGSPMLAPAGKPEEEGGKKGLTIAIVAGAALLAIAAVAVAMIIKPAATAPQNYAPTPPPTAFVPANQPPAAATPTTPSPSSGAQPSEPPSEGEMQARVAADAARKAAEARENDDKRHPAQGGGKRGAAERDKPSAEPPSAAGAKTEPEPAKPADKSPKKAGPSSIDDLLENAIGSGGKSPGGSKPAAAAADANLQEKPSRDDVLNAMRDVTEPVKACSKGQTGVAFANITVSGKTGRVSNVEVTGMTGDIGSCIARAVRKASFPKFRSDNFQVKFPFRM
jgi:predicted Zn finger-like uncharacterized protein